MTKSEIANVLKSCRVAAGLTQGEAASKIGRPQQTLASWETGKSQPDTNTLFALCDLYGVSVDRAFGRGSPSRFPACNDSSDLSFGERLQIARKDMGHTQKQVADAIGVAKSTYNGYENGSREPDLFKIKKLIELLGVSSSWLLGLDDRGSSGYNSFSGGSPACREFPKFLGEDAPPTNSELELLRKLRALSPVHRAAIETLVGQFYPVDSGEKRGDISGTA